MVAPATTRNQARSQPVRAIRRPLGCARGDVGRGNARGDRRGRGTGTFPKRWNAFCGWFPGLGSCPLSSRLSDIFTQTAGMVREKIRVPLAKTGLLFDRQEPLYVADGLRPVNG